MGIMHKEIVTENSSMINKTFKSVFAFLILLFLSIDFTNAQESSVKKSSRVEIIEGKKYYLHTIEKGQTLYSIAKVYELPVNDIVIENPELIDGLPLNKVIKIPAKETKKEFPMVPAGNYKTHVVEKSETLYSISKKYNLTIEQLQTVNPELVDGLKLNQSLRIPATPLANVKTELAARTPDLPDTSVSVKSDSIYNIALMLPLYLDMNGAEKVYKNVNNKETIYSKSEIGVQFYEGALLAIDSLKKLGLNLKIYVYDTGNDSLAVEEILQKNELKKMNLIIGPLYTSNLPRVAEYCKRHRINIVSPFSQINKILLGNSFMSKVTPSVTTQVEQIALFLGEKHNKERVILLHNDAFREKSLIETMRKKLKPYFSTAPDTIAEINYRINKDLASKLSADKHNYIVVPTNDQVFVTEMFNKIRALKNSYKITLIGMESWMNFENIDIEYIHELNLHVPSSAYVDYSDEHVKKFIKTYREEFKTEPSKYSFYGYDITLYYLMGFNKFGKNLQEKLPEFKLNGLQTGFDFYKTAVESGYENKKLSILKYEDYKLVKVN